MIWGLVPLAQRIIARPCSTIKKFNDFRAVCFMCVSYANFVAILMLQGVMDADTAATVVLGGCACVVGSGSLLAYIRYSQVCSKAKPSHR